MKKLYPENVYYLCSLQKHSYQNAELLPVNVMFCECYALQVKNMDGTNSRDNKVTFDWGSFI